jgi:hypothetical protein
MTDYIELLKIEAYAKLKWLNFEIKRMSKYEIDHPSVLLDLLNTRDKIDRFIQLAEINATLPKSGITNQLVTESTNLEIALERAATYITTLQRERDEDRLIRCMILDVVRKSGISTEDILVSLNSQFSTIFYPPAPLITGYPWTAFTFTDSAAFFHEIGHIVFFKYPGIDYQMIEVVENFFKQYGKKNSGIKKNRNEDTKKMTKLGILYWSVPRLNELFADIYASLISGPIYYENVINMVLKDQSSRFTLEELDEHPPSGVRAQVCELVCSGPWLGSREFIKLKDIFNKIRSNAKIPYETETICSINLLKELVSMSIRLIYDNVPGAIKFEPASLEEKKSMDKIPIFVKTLYNGLSIKLQNKEKYDLWEKNAIADILHFLKNQ